MYVVEHGESRWQVLINRWNPPALEDPSEQERTLLDAYFASPSSRAPDGAFYETMGEEFPGIEGDVIMYDATISASPESDRCP